MRSRIDALNCRNAGAVTGGTGAVPRSNTHWEAPAAGPVRRGLRQNTSMCFELPPNAYSTASPLLALWDRLLEASQKRISPLTRRHRVVFCGDLRQISRFVTES